MSKHGTKVRYRYERDGATMGGRIHSSLGISVEEIRI